MSIGLHSAQGAIASGEACPHAALWQEVLTRALEDASGRMESSDQAAHRKNAAAALNWIGSIDFRIVCDLAGMDASMIEGAFHRGRFSEPISRAGARSRAAA